MSSGFEDLRAFLAVAEEGSFLSAAEKLGVSRTTLRRQVDALEAQAGVPLLQRGQSGVALTEAGKRLLGSGRQMEQEFTSLLHAVRETGSRPAGEVRLLLQIGLHPQAIVGIYAQFRAAWPEVRIRARFSEAPLQESLSEADVVVWIGLEEPGSPWETLTVLPMRQHLFADQTYLDGHGTPRTMKELGGHDLLAWAPPGATEIKFTTTDGMTHTIHPTLISTNIHLVHECVGQGLGIGWAPDAALPTALTGEAFVPVLDDLVGRDTALQMAVPRALADVPKVRVLIDSMRWVSDLVSDEKDAIDKLKSGR